MNYRSLVFGTLTLLILAGCTNKAEKKEPVDATENKQVKDSINYKLPILDTLITTYPIQIGNDAGLISVKKIMKDKPNHFIIELDYRNETAFSVFADKHTVINSTKTPFFLDTIQLDYTQGATLTAVNYKAIRGSTLNFSAVVENEKEGKTVEGRFNVFYDPARRGQIYGWITDTVYNKVSIIE